MQFHLNGFIPGDPQICEPVELAPDTANKETLPQELDVLIVGTGPAGLTLAAQLASCPDIRTRIVEQKSGPMEKGQADGISCRSMEMFDAFGFAEKILKEGYWVNETTFWKPDPENPSHIARTGRVQDVEDGLSEMPHVILNQARVHDMYLDVMRNAPTQMEPDYARKLVDLTVNKDNGEYPVTVTLERTDPDHAGQLETLRARYVVGCDGARSVVRKSIGRELKGDAANQAWGVMDVLAVTDFPDIRLKTLIQSGNEGNILIIPREGGYLVRLYVELDKLQADERVRSRNITVDQLIEAAQRIFQPYALDVKQVVWWSVYEIGQRLTDKFDDVFNDDKSDLPAVFITGDACHTHSPKAGQGMNVSMGDSLNLGWKLISVLRGKSKPDLLHSYSSERQGVAKDLIDFDREWARIISAPPESVSATDTNDAPLFQKYFVEHGRYTAGVSVKYKPSDLTCTPDWQHLATGFEIGTRLHSAPVVRLADAKRVHLGTTIKIDGRWRLYAFAGEGDTGGENSAIRNLCTYMATAAGSPYRRYGSKGSDIDEVFDMRAIFQQGHRDLVLQDMPDFLKPQKGEFGLRDYEKIFCAAPEDGQDIFSLRGIDRQRGCLMIVRPDQYVAQILPLDGFEALESYFAGILLPQS